MNLCAPSTALLMPHRSSKHLPVGSTEERLAWAQVKCRTAHVRLTPIREKILAVLAERRIPISLEAVTHVEGIHGKCDAATVYRAMMLFKEVGVVRQVILTNKSSYFVLNQPGESTRFLICRRCGTLTELPEGREIAQVQGEVAQRSGYSELEHEVVFFGLCPRCQTLPARTPWTKVPVR
jgi:Fur family transcriptional regulator, ferric uptake regulator